MPRRPDVRYVSHVARCGRGGALARVRHHTHGIATLKSRRTHLDIPHHSSIYYTDEYIYNPSWCNGLMV
eukprot:scaffold23961_cov131-Isochrysis_galbana.AAC.13